MTLTILKTEPLQPLGPAIPKPAPAAPQSREIKPGIWQAPDGKLRTDFATGQSVAPAQKAAPVTPLPVVPNSLGDGWIAWGGGECPIPDAGPDEYEPIFSDGDWFKAQISAKHHAWGAAGRTGYDYHIVFYRLIPKATE